MLYLAALAALDEARTDADAAGIQATLENELERLAQEDEAHANQQLGRK